MASDGVPALIDGWLDGDMWQEGCECRCIEVRDTYGPRATTVDERLERFIQAGLVCSSPLDIAHRLRSLCQEDSV